MTANRMLDEPLYSVTLHHTNDRPSVKLLTLRTATEVEALLRKGHALTTDPPMPNTRKASVFSEALAAVVRLGDHARQSGDTQLRERANRALIELLRGSGMSFDDDESGAPVPLMRRREHTLPGVGGGRR